jgi:hypothetical protein
MDRVARIALAAGLLASVPAAAAGPASAVSPPSPIRHYSLAVARICAGARLFEHPHQIGTDAGARAAARDIRRSARRRLARVAAVPTPAELRQLSTRWISLQRRQAESYARNWMRIHDAIDAARTPLQRARLPKLLQTFVHAPDRLRRASRKLESALNVPDCTGGDPHPPAVTS